MNSDRAVGAGFLCIILSNVYVCCISLLFTKDLAYLFAFA